jgi:pyrroloquinoline quinone biosynthesis protein E
LVERLVGAASLHASWRDRWKNGRLPAAQRRLPWQRWTVKPACLPPRLMPSAAQVARAAETVAHLRERYRGRMVIDAVAPDYHARLPKPCVGGWGRRSLNVTPAGKVLPCHAAESIAGLEFWSVREHSLAENWTRSPAFNAFRGTAWMQEPCRSCERRGIDFGGWRCQAFAIAGDARAADPVRHLSPEHGKIAAFSGAIDDRPYLYRSPAAAAV